MRKTGTLDKIQNMVISSGHRKKKEEKED